MAKFVKVAGKKTMLKVSVNGKEQWATCTPQVLTFAKNTFKGGEEVEYQSEATGEVGLHITRISKAGQGGTTPVQSTEPKCEDCGKVLKDSKYNKCYTCNQKKPTKTGGSYGKSPEVQESIKKQAIAHATSRTLIALQGQVDRNDITSVMEVIYKKYQELVG